MIGGISVPIFATTDAGSVDTSFVVASSRPSDVVLSPDGLRIYTSSDDGNVRVYHSETGQLLDTLDVGDDLDGLDISPDGNFLIVVEALPLATNGEDQWDAETMVTAYKVDLATGDTTSFPYLATGYDRTFFDVAVLSDGSALLTQRFAGSGWIQLRRLDPDTGNYVDIAGVRHDSILSRSVDGSRVLIGEADASDAPLRVYEVGTGIVAGHELYADGVTGFNRGVQALSADGNLVAQYVHGDGIHIYDGALQYQENVTDTYAHLLTGLAGLAFDETGAFLFILDSDADAVVQLATADWSIVQTVTLGIDLTSDTGDYGNNLLIAPGMRFFSIVTDAELLRVDNPLVDDVLTGTAGNNIITGTGWSETLLGLDGNDTLRGGGGSDRMEGGKGHDIYVVDSAGDEVIEAGSSGSDTVRSSIAFTLPVHFEKLILTGSFGYDGRGNAGDNSLTGNAGANFLSGGRGNDIIDGAAGDDQVMGGLGNDSLRGGAGDDRFYFNSAPGPANIDRILDFSVADDAVYLLRSVFGAAGANGTLAASAFHQGAASADGDDRILYDAATGRIYYDADGTGAAAAIHFATVTAGTALTHADFVLYG